MRIWPVLFFVVACGPGQSTDATGDTASTVTTPLKRSEEAVTFPSTDLDLEGVLTLPKRAAGARVPAVVLIHGCLLYTSPSPRD